MSDPFDPPAPASEASAKAEDPAEEEALAEEDEEDEDEGDFSLLDFDPVRLRYRHDGWTPGRQEDFIRALAACGCVEEAARRVGLSSSSAYDLRARPEAQSFRLAWEAALDMAMPRMTDAAISRAIYGVPVPHFYKGEQVGEHRRYDERLTMWLLRYRDPVRYGKWLDRAKFSRHPEGPALTLLDRLLELFDDALGLLKGRRSPIGPRDLDLDGDSRR
jgi:hypothetical protein